MTPVEHVSDNYPEPIRGKLIELVNEMADANRHLEETAAKVINGFLESGVDISDGWVNNHLRRHLDTSPTKCPNDLVDLFKKWDETSSKQFWENSLNKPHDVERGIYILGLAREAGATLSLTAWETPVVAALAELCEKTLDLCKSSPWYYITVDNNIRATLGKNTAEIYLALARKELNKRNGKKNQ